MSCVGTMFVKTKNNNYDEYSQHYANMNSFIHLYDKIYIQKTFKPDPNQIELGDENTLYRIQNATHDHWQFDLGSNEEGVLLIDSVNKKYAFLCGFDHVNKLDYIKDPNYDPIKKPNKKYLKNKENDLSFTQAIWKIKDNPLNYDDFFKTNDYDGFGGTAKILDYKTNKRKWILNDPIAKEFINTHKLMNKEEVQEFLNEQNIFHTYITNREKIKNWDDELFKNTETKQPPKITNIKKEINIQIQSKKQNKQQIEDLEMEIERD